MKSMLSLCRVRECHYHGLWLLFWGMAGFYLGCKKMDSRGLSAPNQATAQPQLLLLDTKGQLKIATENNTAFLFAITTKASKQTVLTQNGHSAYSLVVKRKDFTPAAGRGNKTFLLVPFKTEAGLQLSVFADETKGKLISANIANRDAVMRDLVEAARKQDRPTDKKGCHTGGIAKLPSSDTAGYLILQNITSAPTSACEKKSPGLFPHANIFVVYIVVQKSGDKDTQQIVSVSGHIQG